MWQTCRSSSHVREGTTLRNKKKNWEWTEEKDTEKEISRKTEFKWYKLLNNEMNVPTELKETQAIAFHYVILQMHFHRVNRNFTVAF